MATLIIIGHLERAEELKAGDPTQGFLFGYTFSVGWSEAARPTISTSGVHPLLPWSWKAIEKVQLFGRLSNSGNWEPVKTQGSQGFEVIHDATPVKIGDIETEANMRYSKATSIDWPDPTSNADISKLEVNDGADPWPAHVVEMSGLPFPLAQRLNLSFAFRANQDLSRYSGFAAAPVLNKDLNLGDELIPSSFQTPIRTADGYASYDQGPAPHTFDIVAACNVNTLDPTLVAVIVNNGQGIEVLSTHVADWQQEFLLGASRLFSVPDFIQFVLAPPQDIKPDSLPKEAPADAFLPTLIAAGVACLRDLISPGLDAGPLGGFPTVRQLLERNPAVKNEVTNSGYNKSFAEMQTWNGFLQNNLPGVGQLSIWNLVARDKSSSSQALSDPTRYYGQLKRDFLTVLGPIIDESKRGVGQSTRPPNHKQVMTALWTAMLASLTAAPKDQINNVKTSLPSLLEDTSYSTLWRDDTLGMFWQNILDNSNSDKDPNRFLARALALSKYFILSRLGLPVSAEETPDSLPAIWRGIPTDWKPQDTSLADWNKAKPVLLQWIDAWHKNVSASFQPSEDVIPDQNSRNPLPVHLQYSSFDQDKDAGKPNVSTSEQDLFRDIRGVGLLVREQDYKNWTPVNLNAAVDWKWNQCVASPVGFPLRSGYIAKLRRGLIAYESEPLSGGTALDNIRGIQNALRAESDVRPALVSADYHTAVRTPQLKYGRKFSFATFSVLNSGILPPVLRNGDEPRAWKSSCPAIPGGWKTREKLYQRTTKIGALRIMRQDAAPCQPAVPPAIPAGTYPRARDIDWASLWKDFKDYRVAPSDPDHLNLALLSPDSWTKKSSVPKSSYQFRVRLPEVTWREWSAWGASLPARNAAGLPDPAQPIIPLDPIKFKAHRADIIAECYETSLKENTKENAMPAVDDPCLNRVLYVELLEEAGGKLVLKDKTFVPIPKLIGDKGRALYQAEGALVTCSHNGGTASSLSLPNPQAITASIQEGKVAVLRIWACLPIEYQLQGKNKTGQIFDKMFARDILPEVKHPDFKYNNKDFLLVSPYDVLIEAASASLPAPATLFSAFRTSLRLKQSDPSIANVVASLPNMPAEASLSNDEKLLFLNVGSVKAQRQSWRWEGRPVPLHPATLESTKPNQFDDFERHWIWDVYPERPDGESVPILMPVRRTPPVSLGVFDSLRDSGCRYFESADGLSAGSGPGQPQLDLRGSHFRFTIEVTSRYESLMKLAEDLKPSRVAHPDPGPTRSSAWKSTYVPSRVTAPPVPKLRLLLPLTEAYDREESQSSSLLAVFDDVFYDEVGLGDTLEAEIESIPVENDPHQFVVQAGKDVLLRKGNEDPSLKRYKEGDPPPVRIALDATQPTIKWSGPIGNYRDLDNRYARFLASSFIIPAPTSKDGTALDVRGWLASIRFRRAVRTRGFPQDVNSPAFRDYSGSDLLAWNPRSYQSAWTESYWVQFLGSFSKFDGFENRIAKLIPSIDDKGVLTLHRKGQLGTVALMPTKVPNFDDSRRLYAVVTQRVFDFRGQYNQELYVATLKQDDDHKSWRGSDPQVLKNLIYDKSDFRVRIIEVAFSTAGPKPKPPDPKDLFDDLFKIGRVKNPDHDPIPKYPDRSPLDAIGSIVRVSEPANSAPFNGQTLDLCEIQESTK
jgi:hypothetical protein